MPSRHHSLSSRNSGFIPLHGGSNRNNDMHSEGIQLTPVRSNVSTGARRPGDMAHTSSIDTTQHEKEGKEQPTHRFRRGRRQKKDEDLGRKDDRGDADDDEGGASLNFMGRLYYKIISFSVVSRYLVYIVPVGLVLAAPLIVLPLTGNMEEFGVGNRTNDDGDRVIGPWLFDVFLWVEIAWLTVWAAKLGAWFLPKLFLFFSGIVSKGTRKYATVLDNLSIPLSLFFWALACFISFRSMFSKFNKDNSDGGIPWVRTFTNIQAALFVCSAVFLGEKAIVQLIGVSYHQRSFAVRIKESKREVRLLGLLYEASRTLFPMYCPEFEEEDFVINDGIEAMIGQAVGGGSKSGSATPMRLIGEVGKVGGKVTSAFGNIASEITGKEVFNPNSAHSIVVEALEKLRTSEALARRIWMSFVVEDREALLPEDFAEVLGPAHKLEADEAFYMVDDDENGDISLDEMIRKVVEIGKERKAIAEGMKDIGQALGAFDKVLLFVVFLLCIFIFLIFFNSSFVTVIASAGTTLLSLSFIFAVTCQEFLGSCIFLFVKHPYDVGDRVEINEVQLVVERISLLYTVFTRNDTQQISQIPNIVLNNYWVDNISRSKAMYESFNVDVSFDTSFEDIELLRVEMEKFVRDPENSRDFKPDFSIGVSGVNSLDKLSLGISILHKSNWHNEMVRASRRSKFMCALAGALKKIPIYGPGGGADALGSPENPSYSVTVSDDIATKARDDSAKAKAEARLVPPPGDADEAKDAEEAAVSGINNRPPVREMAATGQWDGQQQTLGSDLAREESRRSRDIEGVRSDLLKRASTRGRRRQGESMQSLVVEGEEGAAASPVSPTHSRRELWDEEAQAAGRPSMSGSMRWMPRSGSIRSPLSPRHPPTEHR